MILFPYVKKAVYKQTHLFLKIVFKCVLHMRSHEFYFKNNLLLLVPCRSQVDVGRMRVSAEAGACVCVHEKMLVPGTWSSCMFLVSCLSPSRVMALGTGL